MIGLVGALDGYAEVVGLLLRQGGQSGPEFFEMQPGHFLIEMLGQHVDLVFVGVAPREQLDLGDDLVAEAVRHDEGGVAGGAAEIEQPAFGQDEDGVPVGEDPLVDLVAVLTGILDVDLLDPGDPRQRRHFDLVVKVADVADDGIVLHPFHVLDADDVLVAGRGHEDIPFADHMFERTNLVALHQGLQGTDRVDFGDDDPGALPAQRLTAALAHVPVTADHGHLAREHDVGRPHDAVDQAVATAIDVVELALGHRIVDVHGRKRQRSLFLQLVESMHAGGGFFGDAAHGLAHGDPVVALAGDRIAEALDQFDHVLRRIVTQRRNPALLPFGALEDHHGGIAAVVEDHVRHQPIRPAQRLLGAPPVLGKGLALPGEDRHAFGVFRRTAPADDRGSGRFVLGGKDVARGPADLGAEIDKRLDQNSRLDRHVQRAGDPGPLERLLLGILLAQGHQPRHLHLGKFNLLASPGGQRQVLDPVIVLFHKCYSSQLSLCFKSASLFTSPAWRPAA